VHSGPVIAGRTTSNFDIWGDSVNIASRLESSGEMMKVQISEQVKTLLPPDIDVSEKQITNLKSKGELNTYFIVTD
tara:strand:- start:302 stop:529 length:228 start_codon:yes stop_codon:yes gene_type:complete